MSEANKRMSVPPDQLMEQVRAVMVCRGHSPESDPANASLRCATCHGLGWIEAYRTGALRLAGLAIRNNCVDLMLASRWAPK